MHLSVSSFIRQMPVKSFKENSYYAPVRTVYWALYIIIFAN